MPETRGLHALTFQSAAQLTTLAAVPRPVVAEARGERLTALTWPRAPSHRPITVAVPRRAGE